MFTILSTVTSWGSLMRVVANTEHKLAVQRASWRPTRQGASSHARTGPRPVALGIGQAITPHAHTRAAPMKPQKAAFPRVLAVVRFLQTFRVQRAESSLRRKEDTMKRDLKLREKLSGKILVPALLWFAGAPFMLVFVLWLLFFRGK